MRMDLEEMGKCDWVYCVKFRNNQNTILKKKEKVLEQKVEAYDKTV